MQDFRNVRPDPNPEHYKHMVESALLAAALKGSGEEETDTRKAIWSLWFQGSFAAAVHDIRTMGESLLEWRANRHTGLQFDLVWHSPTGLSCNLARVYRQPDGSWAALVNAGVSDRGPEDAMAKAEWAISRLTS